MCDLNTKMVYFDSLLKNGKVITIDIVIHELCGDYFKNLLSSDNMILVSYATIQPINYIVIRFLQTKLKS